MVRRVFWIGAVLVLVAAVGLAGVWLHGQPAGPALAQTRAEGAAAEYSPNQIITVLGQGSVRIQPDVARLSIGVETMAESVAEAVADNEAQIVAVLEALEAAGIAEEDIQTTNYSVYSERYPEAFPQPVGESARPASQYRVSNTVHVTVRDLEKVGDVLDAVVEAGANNIWGVSFGLENSAVAQADARAKAVVDALARAEALATLNGVGLGPVMAVSEVVGGNAFPVAVTKEVAMGAGDAIRPGELEISYQVQVSYFIDATSAAALGMANPASVYCEEQGYELEIRTADDGSQAGYCVFPDGTECEEWAFFRGECKPGTATP